MFNKHHWTSKNGRHHDVWASLFNFDIKDIVCTRNLKYICNDLKKCIESTSSNPNHRLSLRLSSNLVEGTARLYKLKAEQLVKEYQRLLNLCDAEDEVDEEETIGIEDEVLEAPTASLNLLDLISNVQFQQSTLNSTRPCEDLEPVEGDMQDHLVGDPNILPIILVHSPVDDANSDEDDDALRVQPFNPTGHSSPHLQSRSQSSGTSESELPTVVLEESSLLDEDGTDDDGVTKNTEPAGKDSSDAPQEDENITRKNTSTVYAEIHNSPTRHSAFDTESQPSGSAVTILPFPDIVDSCESSEDDSPPTGDKQRSGYAEIQDPPIQYSTLETGNQPGDRVVKRLTSRDSSELEIDREIIDDNSLPTGGNQTSTVYAEIHIPPTRHSAFDTESQTSGRAVTKLPFPDFVDSCESSEDDSPPTGDKQRSVYAEIQDPPMQYSALETGNQPSDRVVKRLTFRDSSGLEIYREITDDNSLPTGGNQASSVRVPSPTKRPASNTANNESGIPQKKTNIDGDGADSESSIDDPAPNVDDNSEISVDDSPLTGDDHVISLVLPGLSSFPNNPNDLKIVIAKLSAHKELYKQLQKK